MLKQVIQLFNWLTNPHQEHFSLIGSAGVLSSPAWKNSTWNQCNEKRVDYGASCAGSIADNNWKVIYKWK